MRACVRVCVCVCVCIFQATLDGTYTAAQHRTDVESITLEKICFLVSPSIKDVNIMETKIDYSIVYNATVYMRVWMGYNDK